MAAPDEATVKRAAGQLCVGPTDLGTAYPHGGTALGLVTEVRLITRTREFVIRAEEYGLDATDSIHLGNDFNAVFMVKGYDQDLLNLFPWAVSAGGSSGDALIAGQGGVSSGSLLSSSAVKLCFSPFNSTHPGFILYRALPNFEKSTSIRFGIDDDWGFLAVFRALRDGSDNVMQIGRLEDMSV